ncbi:hypothetical protein FDP41_000126 [Naegleria fowleri]|uniref:START domain-containing protein n=1 Tax=Naegleria fowleri TaxID=5763 RepID=A0A6A5C711_NAEFO|nr:uncharacterized protein FDP41_000126 [Naegleria fowleri]KAF0985087.1 hypothetical protein FDP41_000126 [Naegleria fowleri]CAG4716366.1 unnamed protein product [Naegleria fowleri]
MTGTSSTHSANHNQHPHVHGTSNSLEEEMYAMIKRFMSEFKRIENYLSLNLKDSQFQEFVEWSEFKNLVQTKGIAFLNSIAELKPFSHTSFVESLTEMNIPRITVKQCKLIKNMMLKNNSLWNTLLSKSNYTVSLSNNQYLLGNEATSSNNGGVQFFKYDIVFPYPKSAVINTLLSTKMRFKFDKNTKVLSKIDYQQRQDEEHLATCITQEVYAFPFPFQAREFVLACSMVNDSTDQCTMLCVRSCESDKAAPLKRTVFAVNIGGWIFQDLPGSQCRFIQFVGAEFKGILPKSLVTKSVSKRARYYYADTLKLFEANSKEGFPEPTDDPIFESFMNTLKENGTIAL